MESAPKMQDSYIGSRFEFKYILDTATAAAVEQYLEDLSRFHFARDAYASDSAGGAYTVTSLYFDTPQLDDFWDKEAAILRRVKLRARIYAPSFAGYDGDAWLEIKRKHDMRVLKDRTRISNAALQALLAGDWSVLSGTDDDVARAFIYRFAKYNYRPAAVVRYERKPYVARYFSSVRVTLDSHIAACRPSRDPFGFHEVMPGVTILEVKFNHGLPWWFRSMVERFNLVRTDFSKYTHSIDTIFMQQHTPIGV